MLVRRRTPARVGPRKPAWPIRLAVLTGWFALLLVGSNWEARVPTPVAVVESSLPPAVPGEPTAETTEAVAELVGCEEIGRDETIPAPTVEVVVEAAKSSAAAEAPHP